MYVCSYSGRVSTLEQACVYVCLDRLRTRTDTHDSRYGGSRALLPPRITRWVDLAFARVSVLVRQIYCARQAHAMASHARHIHTYIHTYIHTGNGWGEG